MGTGWTYRHTDIQTHGQTLLLMEKARPPAVPSKTYWDFKVGVPSYNLRNTSCVCSVWNIFSTFSTLQQSVITRPPDLEIPIHLFPASLGPSMTCTCSNHVRHVHMATCTCPFLKACARITFHFLSSSFFVVQKSYAPTFAVARNSKTVRGQNKHATCMCMHVCMFFTCPCIFCMYGVWGIKYMDLKVPIWFITIPRAITDLT